MGCAARAIPRTRSSIWWHCDWTRASCGARSSRTGPLLLALAHPELEALGDEDSARRFELLVERYERTLDGARDIRESIYGSFDVLIARTGHRTNEIVKVLTLASVIFLPGALIAGIMGMNFKPSLFSHPLLFWVTVAVIVSIGVVTLVAARARRWI